MWFRRFFRELFCLHNWRQNGKPTDYCNLFQVFHDDGARLRRTYYQCTRCGKRSETEEMVHT